MGSYGIAAVFRSRRYDSFNRKLADDLARQEPQAGLFEMNGHINDKNKESPGNWIRQSLARVKVGSTRPR
jgi:hypothetical protein